MASPPRKYGYRLLMLICKSHLDGLCSLVLMLTLVFPLMRFYNSGLTHLSPVIAISPPHFFDLVLPLCIFIMLIWPYATHMVSWLYDVTSVVTTTSLLYLRVIRPLDLPRLARSAPASYLAHLLSDGFRFFFHATACLIYATTPVVWRALRWIVAPPSLHSWYNVTVSMAACEVNWNYLLFFCTLFYLVKEVQSADDSSAGSAAPRFKGTRISYPGWFTEFCGWIAMKFPDLIELIQGEWEEPDEPDDDADDEAREAHKRYWNAQKRLYGALVGAVPASVRQALSANARFHGTQALEILQQRFGVVDAHDRSSALKRVQKSYITPGSGISLKDATRQYDRMTEAHTEYTDAGGNELDDELLRTYFLSAFPPAYQPIKMAVRTQVFATFDELAQAFITQVKQAEDDMGDHQNVPAFNAPQFQQAQPHQQLGMFGRGRGGARGGRGGRGVGRGGLIPAFVTCLRCGVIGHARNACQQAVVQCAHCMADHLSALCPLGAGGAQRDALTSGARTLLDQDVQRMQNGNGNAANNAHPAGPHMNQQQQIAALLAAQQQLQQQLAALAQPALPAPLAAPAQHGAVAGQQNQAPPTVAELDNAALAQALQANFPQFGANAHQTGFVGTQNASSFYAIFADVFVAYLHPAVLYTWRPLLILFSLWPPSLYSCFSWQGGTHLSRQH